jgi:hypothetical protein
MRMSKRQEKKKRLMARLRLTVVYIMYKSFSRNVRVGFGSGFWGVERSNF